MEMHLRLARGRWRYLIKHLPVLIALHVHSWYSLFRLTWLRSVADRILSWKTSVRLVVLLVWRHRWLRVLWLRKDPFISHPRGLELLGLILSHTINLLLSGLRWIVSIRIVSHLRRLLHLLIRITSSIWLLSIRWLILSHPTFVHRAKHNL